MMMRKSIWKKTEKMSIHPVEDWKNEILNRKKSNHQILMKEVKEKFFRKKIIQQQQRQKKVYCKKN